MNQSQGGNPFGRLVEFARPHKTGYIISVVLAVLGVAFGIVPFFATARMTIELLSGNRDLSFYMMWCLISGGGFVLKAILMGISTRASHEATFAVLSEARRKIASKLTRVPMGYILNTPSGQLKNGMVERIEQLEVPLAHVIPEMTSNLLVPIAIIIYLFILDWRMALVSLITIPVGMMCYMGMIKEYPKKYGEVVKAGNHMSATTVEYIGGIEVIKAFNQADNSYQKFTDAVHANADLILDWMKDTQKYSAIMMSVWPAALISVLPVGCLFYMNGSLSSATFITVTLTRLINGLIPHYYEGTLTGQTIVEGIDVKNVSLYALSGVVGSVFQNPRTQFFTVDTTSEIAFGCENLAIDADEINSRIEKTVGALKIEDLLNRSLFALSGGEKQKVACASVSAMEPDIFVLDEPSSNLDIKSIRELKDVLRKWKAQGKTIVIAEHRLYYLMDIADRILYMQGGQIKENLSISDFKKKSTGELHALGLRTLQSEDFSKMQSTVCATKQLYIRDFEVSYKNASGGKKKKRKVLDISDLMIPQGSVVGVVGNNGAGKTTFANNLCGLLKTAKGCMSMNGKTYMANQRIKTCYMVMQDVNHQLFTESVMDEILLSLDNSDEEKAAHEAESIMESLHISEFRDAHPMSLSGGQKQRVAIASAIASDKQVIVFDEPTSGLDYRHMKKVAENLRELSSLGKTLFIVTHDPELIAECCNYFVFIENGKVLWSDGWNRISRERLQRFFAFEGD